MAAFRAAHPNCCFCGGQVETAERDHVPPRASFFGKVWPEGYEFPACATCNRRTRFEDQYFAWHIRMFGWPSEWLEADAANTEALSQGIRNNQPLRRPISTHWWDETNWLSKNGLLGGPYRAVKLRPEAIEALEATYRKMVIAFYYKHVGRALPRSAGIGSKIKNNLMLERPETLLTAMQVARFAVAPKRGPDDFLGQFIYSHDYNEEQGLFAIAAKFGQSVFGLAACAERPDELTLEEVFDLYGLDDSLMKKRVA